jgi:hypothetical protein
MGLVSSLAWAVLSALCAAPASALEGAPPLEWFPTGPVAAETESRFELAPEVGMGFSPVFEKAPAERQMKVKQYGRVPLAYAYGIITGLEGTVVLPFYWGVSDQVFTNNQAEVPGTMSGRLTGADFGDLALSLRWRALASEDERTWMVMGFGYGAPLGTNVWENVRYNFGALMDVPDLAIGDGAHKLLLSAGGRTGSDPFGFEGVLGYIWRIPVSDTVMVGYGSTMQVNLPSPVVGVLKFRYGVAEEFDAVAAVSGFYAPKGSFSAGGYLAQVPGAAEKVADSYANLLARTGGLWVGGGAEWSPAPSWRGSLGADAPVWTLNSWRFVRIRAGLSFVWKP